MKKLMKIATMTTLLFALVFCAMGPVETNVEAKKVAKPYYTWGGKKITGTVSLSKGKSKWICSHQGGGVEMASSSDCSIVKIEDVDSRCTATGGGVKVKGKKKGTATVTITDGTGIKTKIKIKVK